MRSQRPAVESAQTVEISSPTPSALDRKSIVPSSRTKISPRNGTSNHQLPRIPTTTTLASPTSRNGSVLPTINSVGADRRNHQLFERADLPLAHHREGRQLHHRYEHQSADHAGHEKPSALEIGVVPGALLQFDVGREGRERGSQPVGHLQLIVLGKSVCDLIDVSDRDQRSVRVGAVEHGLHRRGLPLAQQFGEARLNLEHQDDAPMIEQRRDLRFALQDVAHLEAAAGAEALKKFAAFLAMIVIEHRGRNAIHFVARGVAEYQHLQQRRHDQREARMRVAKQVDEFLDQNLAQPLYHVSPSCQRLVE